MFYNGNWFIILIVHLFKIITFILLLPLALLVFTIMVSNVVVLEVYFDLMMHILEYFIEYFAWKWLYDQDFYVHFYILSLIYFFFLRTVLHLIGAFRAILLILDYVINIFTFNTPIIDTLILKNGFILLATFDAFITATTIHQSYQCSFSFSISHRLFFFNYSRGYI